MTSREGEIEKFSIHLFIPQIVTAARAELIRKPAARSFSQVSHLSAGTDFRPSSAVLLSHRELDQSGATGTQTGPHMSCCYCRQRLACYTTILAPCLWIFFFFFLNIVYRIENNTCP